MCDYSLEMYRTKPAREGERYITTRFPSGTIGLASPGDLVTPVCVQCDTSLRLEGIPAELQKRLGVAATGDVTFMRLDKGHYRDGVRFANGAELSLQQLPPGVSAIVILALEKASPPFQVLEAL